MREMANASKSDHPSVQANFKAGERLLFEPVRRLCACLSTSITERSFQPETIERRRQAMRLLGELQTFAVPPGPELPRETLEAGRDAVAKITSTEYAQEIFWKAGEHRRGKPVTRRHVAAAALEAKQHIRLERIKSSVEFL
jgi:hypothetical protein